MREITKGEGEEVQSLHPYLSQMEERKEPFFAGKERACNRPGWRVSKGKGEGEKVSHEEKKRKENLKPAAEKGGGERSNGVFSFSRRTKRKEKKKKRKKRKRP